MTKMTLESLGTHENDEDELGIVEPELCLNTSNGSQRGFRCSLPKGHTLANLVSGNQVFDHECIGSEGKSYYRWKDSQGVPNLPRQINANDEFAGVGRTILIAMILTQRAKIAELENDTSRLLIKGWFCGHCNGFNGEERELHLVCRLCDKPKLLRK